jgi:hypothetical protein
MPITQWFTDTVPQIEASAWRVRLSVDGAIRGVSPDELAGTDTVRAVLDCTNGWYAEQIWRERGWTGCCRPARAAACWLPR